MAGSIEYSVEHGDVLQMRVDVLLMKHAQEFHGVDAELEWRLRAHSAAAPVVNLRVAPGEHRLIAVPLSAGVNAAWALFVGTPPVQSFGYSDVRRFTHDALRALASSFPEATSIATTLHGPGTGLDEVECALAQLGGCLDALDVGDVPTGLRVVHIVELERKRYERVRLAVDKWLFKGRLGRDDLPANHHVYGRHPTPPGPGAGMVNKPRVFVAMPFAKDMEDVFHYGIQGPVRRQGFICERVDQEAFTGEIVDQVKHRIESAAVVIADLTSANPNVYLEIGYAWGKGRPCILLIGGTEEPRFDVRGVRHIRYSTIKELEGLLEREITQLLASGQLGE